MKTKNQAVIKDVKMWSFKKKDFTVTLWGFNREIFLITGWIFPNITVLSIEATCVRKKGNIYTLREGS